MRLREHIKTLCDQIALIDGGMSSSIRQQRIHLTIARIEDCVDRLFTQVAELKEAAERYQDLADQRLLNHLNIDQEHIINICNESLQEVATDELSPMALLVDPDWEVPIIQPTTEPLSIPPIPIAEIDFQ